MKKLFTAALVLLIAVSFSAKKITIQETKLVATGALNPTIRNLDLTADIEENEKE